MKLILRWVLNALTLIAIAYYLPGVEVAGFYAALITALILGLVNAVIRPVLILLTLPINLLTLGFFTFVINGLMFWFVATIVEGFDVANYTAAFFGALILSLVSWLLGWAIKRD
jgi:putative membrane protein